MDVTTMPSTDSLLKRVAGDYPALTFELGEHFEWRPTESVIVYEPSDLFFDAHLLHETAHAVLKHARYERDIDLIKMERDAWELVRTDLGAKYGVDVPAHIIHHDMDTYRDWLHSRSTCPKCQSTGLQVKNQEYRCVSCSHTWRVNEARTCALRRYSVNETTSE